MKSARRISSVIETISVDLTEEPRIVTQYVNVNYPL